MTPLVVRPNSNSYDIYERPQNIFLRQRNNSMILITLYSSTILKKRIYSKNVMAQV